MKLEPKLIKKYQNINSWVLLRLKKVFDNCHKFFQKLKNKN